MEKKYYLELPLYIHHITTFLQKCLQDTTKSGFDSSQKKDFIITEKEKIRLLENQP